MKLCEEVHLGYENELYGRQTYARDQDLSLYIKTEDLGNTSAKKTPHPHQLCAMRGQARLAAGNSGVAHSLTWLPAKVF